MKHLLITGGTTFVSRYTAAYFVRRGYRVHVLNRGTRRQPEDVTLIQADRAALGDTLKGYHFDAVLDITSYTREDVERLTHALGQFDDYIFISSSAVYPEINPQPFDERQACGPNSHWGAYGLGKLEAEQYLTEHVPQSYLLRPPYLYGPMQNLYREPFVFECAEAGLPFCLPGNGDMTMQFFHVEDLCRFMALLLERHPKERIYNVGNPDSVTVRRWAELCYQAVGKPFDSLCVSPEHPQWAYFPFRDYDYRLDVSRMLALMPSVKPLEEGLAEEYTWFASHREEVKRKALIDYIQSNILK